MQNLTDWFLQNAQGWDWPFIGGGFILYFLSGLFYALECYKVEGKRKRIIKMMPMIFCGPFVCLYLYWYIIPRNEIEASID